MAAKSTDTLAGICAQGLCYEIGIGGVIIKNLDKAKDCYGVAAKQGYIPAMCALGFAFKSEAVTTTESTSSGRVGGHSATTTTTHLHKDETKLSAAVSLLTSAAEAGYPSAFGVLGYLYEMGYGVQQSYNEAIKLYRLGAEKGAATAKRNLGLCYEYGRGGVEASSSEARRWYEAAGAQGYDVREDLSRISPCCTIL